MAQTLLPRFLAAEEQFLGAFSAGPDALASFDKAWAALSKDYTFAVEERSIDTNTMSLADSIASRIAIIAESFSALHVTAEKVTNTFKQDIEKIHLEIDTTEQGHGVQQSLHMLAKRWLLQNLIDPYPSSADKAKLAQQCGCSVQDVQEWFAHARRQIGWTALCTERFNGSRCAASEAASIAYSAPRIGGRLSADIQRAFANIQTIASNLLPGPYLPPDLVDVGEENAFGEVSDVCVTLESQTGNSDHRILHPDAWSIGPSLDNEEDVMPPPPIAGCKRRSDTFDESVDEEAQLKSMFVSMSGQPTKRRRFILPSIDADGPICPDDPLRQRMESCSPNRFEPVSPDQDYTGNNAATLAFCGGDIEPIPSTSPTLSHSRKRTRSDAAFGNLTKRPRGSMLEPRKQVVSDPLPINSSSISLDALQTDDWFQSNFGFHEPVDISELDASLLFDDDQLATFNSTSSDRAPSSSLDALWPTSQFDVPDEDLISGTRAGFDLSTPSCANNFPAASDLASPYHSAEIPSDAISTLPSPSAVSASDIWDSSLALDLTSFDWTQDWGRFVDILNSSNSSPSSSESSLSDLLPPFPAPDVSSSSSPHDTTCTLFGVAPSSPSSTPLSHMSDFSSLHVPLEAIF